ncbi:MAG: hypothetical protein PHC40_04960 [Eubacteriales bacterium]|nr:hypothetical protein [Eubacteriales bacterium]
MSSKDIQKALLMCGDQAIAEIRDGEVFPVPGKENLLPMYFQAHTFVEPWLASRAIDRHRINSRLLKKALRLEERDDVSTVLYVNAATITDNYWIKDPESNQTYKEIRFSENYFDKLALYGDVNSFSFERPSRTPELTSIGSFEKCWRLEDGAWWMYKSGRAEELFSELFVYKLGCALGFPMAEYKMDGEYIKTKDFTEGKWNFEPAASFLGDNEDYSDNYHAFQQFGQRIADEYLSLIVLDTLCVNMDRHTYNYGVLRDQETGEILRLAPNFDNNIALIARGFLSPGRRQEGLLTLFKDFVQKEGLKPILPICSETMIDKILMEMDFPVDKGFVKDFILSRYEEMRVLCREPERIPLEAQLTQAKAEKETAVATISMGSTQKTEATIMNKTKAWDYALGIIRADGLEPSKEFLELVEKEKRGEITEQDILKHLDQKYRTKADTKKKNTRSR